MKQAMMRTHVVLPKEMVGFIDAVAGKRKRSEFIEQVVAEKIMHMRQGDALRAAAGAWKDHPRFKKSSDVHSYVRDSRDEVDARAKRNEY